jgi:hypothetical protein
MMFLRNWIRAAIACAIVVCLAAPMLRAQTYTTVPTFAKTPEHWLQQIVNADTTSTVTGVDCTVTTYGCGNLGTKITSIIATSTDSASNTLELSINNGTETSILASVNIPVFAGDSNNANTSNPPVNVLQLGNIPGLMLDSDGNPVLIITASEKLLLNTATNVTAAKAINVFIQGPVF